MTAIQWREMDEFWFHSEVRLIGFPVGCGERRKEIKVRPKDFGSGKKKELLFSGMRKTGGWR